MPTPDTPQRWTWPHGRAIVLYHWSWYDRGLAEIVNGWSQRGETDDAGYLHLEAESIRDAETMQVDQGGEPLVEPHTFTGLTLLPPSLLQDNGRPLKWIRALLGTE